MKSLDKLNSLICDLAMLTKTQYKVEFHAVKLSIFYALGEKMENAYNK